MNDARTLSIPGFDADVPKQEAPAASPGVHAENRRRHGKRTVNMRRLGSQELNDLRVPFLSGFDVETLTNGAVVEYPKDIKRPRTRGECEGQEGICPLVSCRFHLALDVNEETGSIKNNFPVHRPNPVTGEDDIDFYDVDFDAMKFTCALDVAELAQELSLKELADTMGLSYDRAFQTIDEAKKRAHEVAVEIGAAEGLPVRRKQEPPPKEDAENDNAEEEPGDE